MPLIQLKKAPGRFSLQACLKLILILVVVVYPALQVGAQGAPPLFPALCYGELTVNGMPAPLGTVVEAKVDGVSRGRLVSTEEGWYGGSGLKSKLMVEGGNLAGKAVRFYVSGSFEENTYSDVFAWEEPYWGSGEVMQINLGVKSVESNAQPDPPSVPVPNPLPVPTEDADPYPELSSGIDSGSDRTPGRIILAEPDSSEDDGDEIPEAWLIGVVVLVVAIIIVMLVGLFLRKTGRKTKQKIEKNANGQAR